MADTPVYVTGGTVQAGGGVYLERAADAQLLGFCRAGSFAYVLTSRQMGKSSLMVRTAEELQQEGVRSVILDLTALGSLVTADQWYRGFLVEVMDQLELTTNVESWWAENSGLGIPQRFVLFLRDVVLREITDRIVIFVDEIDSTLSLDFTDDFFAAIRYLYNARNSQRELSRLGFVLIGVATPSGLIKDPARTPFNIGQRVDLTDFTFEEALPLLAGSRVPAEMGQRVLRCVLDWTGGHPYLTLQVFRSLQERPLPEWSELEVGRRVAELYFGENSDKDSNLLFVREMLTTKAFDQEAVLTAYGEIRRGKRAPDDEHDVVKSWLKLSGVVCSVRGHLRVRNRIYEEVFPPAWVRRHLKVNWPRRLARIGLLLTILWAVIAPWLVSSVLDKKAIAEKEKAFALAEGRRADHERRRAENERRVADVLRARAERASTEANEGRIRESGLRKFAEDKASEAERQRRRAQRETAVVEQLMERLANESEIRQLATQAALLQKTRPDLIAVADLLAVESLHRYQFPEAVDVLRRDLGLLRQPSGELSDETITDFVFSPDGRRVVTLGVDAAIWDVKSREKVGTEEQSFGASAVAFSSEGPRAALDDGGKLRIQNIESGQVISELNVAVDMFTRVAFDKDGGRVLVDDRSMIEVWDVASKKKQLPSEEAKVQLLPLNVGSEASALSPDGKWLAIVGDDKKVRVWSVDQGNLIADLDLPRGTNTSNQSAQRLGTVTAITFSQDGRRLATAGPGREVNVWDLQKKSLLTQFVHQGDVTSVAFSPDASEVISGSEDTTARIWELETGRELARMLHATEVISVAFAPPDGSLVLTVDMGSPRFWDWRSSPRWTEFEQQGSVVDLDLTRDRKVAVGTLESGASVWDADGRKIEISHDSAVNSVALSPDGNSLATGDNDGKVQIWDLKNTDQPLREFTHEDSIYAVAFSPDGKHLLTGSADKKVRVVRVNDGKQEWEREHESQIFAAVFSPDGRWVASADNGGHLRLWDSRTGDPLDVIPGQQVWTIDEAIYALAVYENQIAIGGVGRAIVLDRTRREDNPRYFVHTVELRGDESGEGSKRRSQRDLLEGFGSSEIYVVGFSADGKYLLTAGADQTARIWDLKKRGGDELARFVYDTPVFAGSFTSDPLVMALAADGRVQFSFWNPKELIVHMCRYLPRNLNAEEWRQYMPDGEPYHQTCANLPPADLADDSLP